MALTAAEDFSNQVGPIVAGMGLFAVVLGIAFLMVGRGIKRRRADFGSRAVAVPGQVVDNVWGPDSSPSVTPLAFPVLRYQLPDGTAVEERSFEGASPPVARKGSAVTVLYDPDDPRRARIAQDGFAYGVIPNLGVMIGAFLVGGGLLTVAGAAALVVLV